MKIKQTIIYFLSLFPYISKNFLLKKFFISLIIFLFPHIAVFSQVVGKPPAKKETVTNPIPSKKEENTSSEAPKKEETAPAKTKGKKPFFTFAEYESMEKYVKIYPHRLRFRMGIGIGTLKPAILEETGPSWLMNSFLRSAQDPSVLPIAIPASRVKNLPTVPQYRDISYGWKNKFDISYSDDRILGKYDQSSPAVVRFLTPRTERYWAALFEGNRLLRFEGRNQDLRVSYTHPVLDWIMVGPSLNYHRYTEKNEVTSGSYSTTRDTITPPNQTTWSVGGSSSADYVMKGFAPGIYAKFQLNSWWEVRTRFELLQRSGNFFMGGSQTVQVTQQGGLNPTTEFIFPVYWGKAKDSGSVIMLESSMRYCRFTLDIGIIHRSFTRKYSSYLGETLGNINRYDYSTRTSLFGLGELQGSFKHSSTEFFFMPSVSFHFDREGIH